MIGKDLSIRQKLTWLAVVGTTIGLLAASAAFVLLDRADVREAMARRQLTLSEIVGSNSVSALLFDDREAAAETLSGLRAEPHVQEAGIYDEAGRPFATWSRSAAAPPALPPPAASATARFEPDALVVFQPVVFEGRRVGTVYLRSDLEELHARRRRYVEVVAVVLLASIVLGAFVSSRLQRAIVEPILRLAETARRVSRDRDYAVRAPEGGADETGLLVTTFNEMLGHIQRRESELKEAHALLERRVEERTHALARSQEMLAEAQRIAHLGSWEWDLATAELLWSDEMYRIYGVDRAAFRPRFPDFLDLVHPADRERALEYVQRAREGARDLFFEHRIRRVSDGDERVVSVHAQVERDEEGRIRRLVGTAQDVTERKAAEEERAQLIREQATRAEAEAARRRAAYLAEVGAALSADLDFETVLSTLARVTVPEVADWCVVLVATGDARLDAVAAHHVDPARVASLWALAAKSPPDPRNLGGALEVLRSGEPILHESVPPFRQLLDDDTQVLVQEVGLSAMMLVPLRARDNTLGVLTLGATGARRFGLADLVLARSVADRGALAADNARLYREAQDASRLKDEFLATLSHELRTPLNAIVGWTRMLQSGTLPPDQARRAVDIIDRNARAQTQLIEDILDVSRIVAGKLHLDVQPVDLPAIVEAAIDSMRHAAESKEIRVHADLRPLPDPMRGDAGRMQQVVWNLLSNAIKFTPRGGNVWVTLDAADGQVRLSVKDDGAGIPPAFLPHVFERFRQADSSSTRRHGGLGLGLAIVRHIAELHGGTVEAHSEGPGRGSTFTVRLPLRPSRPEAVARPVVPAGASLERRPSDAVLKGLNVLVVEDEPDARELVSAVLSRLGARVKTAVSADEALAAFDAGPPPDAIVSDIEMPGMDGYELMRKVRSLPPERGGRVPAAALTAYARPEDRVAALTAGYQIHIAKPVQPEELAAVVASLTGRVVS